MGDVMASVRCPVCLGEGRMMKVLARGPMGYPPCVICGGTGEIRETETHRLRAEIIRLREALKEAETYLAEDLENRFLSNDVWNPRGSAPKEACDCLAKIRAALGKPEP